MLLICSATNQQKSNDINKTSCSTNPGIEGWNKQAVSKSLATQPDISWWEMHHCPCWSVYIYYIYIYHNIRIYLICIVWYPQEQTIQVSNVKGCEVTKNPKLGHTVLPTGDCLLSQESSRDCHYLSNHPDRKTYYLQQT